ncbi:protein of unknown function DUF1279 [Macrophomina phaseolina MS6]|uniref:DUF1279 domain-containing protein n=2 Tax=Macrophomina phaseolina TaxID=35725 RepID=K2SYD9_MACPH|nr:protein of unknown function DUF1279 [Macrophomina phaseolina MS6]KAH7021765.1 hypothetical protein B0J12DRAFT_746384 [Macrophomina phaseolina]
MASQLHLLRARQLTTTAAARLHRASHAPTLPRRLCRASQPALRPHSAPVSPLSRLLRSPAARRFNGTSSKPPNPNPTPNLGSPQAAPSFSQRMRKLSREYGWVALGVYLGLSVLDFPFCFLAVRMLGTDRIGRWEHAVVQAFWRVVHVAFPNVHQQRQTEGAVQTEAGQVQDGAMQEIEAAEKASASEEATIWTQLALAYAIHKSFIFLRVPLTAAVTPKVVKVLRGWGWNIGKRKPKA